MAKKPFDWEGFITWLETNAPLIFQVIRLFIGLKKMKAKAEEYNAHVEVVEAAKEASNDYNSQN